MIGFSIHFVTFGFTLNMTTKLESPYGPFYTVSFFSRITLTINCGKLRKEQACPPPGSRGRMGEIVTVEGRREGGKDVEYSMYLLG